MKDEWTEASPYIFSLGEVGWVVSFQSLSTCSQFVASLCILDSLFSPPSENWLHSASILDKSVKIFPHTKWSEQRVPLQWLPLSNEWITGWLQAFYFCDFVSHGTAVQPRVWTQSSTDVKSRWGLPYSPRGSAPWFLLLLWSLPLVPWLLCVSFSLTLSLYILLIQHLNPFECSSVRVSESNAKSSRRSTSLRHPRFYIAKCTHLFQPIPYSWSPLTWPELSPTRLLLFTSLLCLLLISLPIPTPTPTITPTWIEAPWS